jgi:hypothetical protein
MTGSLQSTEHSFKVEQSKTDVVRDRKVRLDIEGFPAFLRRIQENTNFAHNATPLTRFIPSSRFIPKCNKKNAVRE